MRTFTLITLLLLLALVPAYGYKGDDARQKSSEGDDARQKSSEGDDARQKNSEGGPARSEGAAACPDGSTGVRCHAQQGQADAQYDWGMMLLDGEGVQADHMEALKWLSRAAKQGHGRAGYMLARLSLSSEPGGACAR